MIDLYEQGARQMLVDEYEAKSPSLATWALAEFDAGLSAAEVRSLLFMAGGDALALLTAAEALADSVQRDETGDMIGGQFVGNGNGGNLSQTTLKAKGRLQLTLNDIKKLLSLGSKKG